MLPSRRSVEFHVRLDGLVRLCAPFGLSRDARSTQSSTEPLEFAERPTRRRSAGEPHIGRRDVHLNRQWIEAAVPIDFPVKVLLADPITLRLERFRCKPAFIRFEAFAKPSRDRRTLWSSRRPSSSMSSASSAKQYASIRRARIVLTDSWYNQDGDMISKSPLVFVGKSGRVTITYLAAAYAGKVPNLCHSRKHACYWRQGLELLLIGLRSPINQDYITPIPPPLNHHRPSSASDLRPPPASRSARRWHFAFRAADAGPDDSVRERNSSSAEARSA